MTDKIMGAFENLLQTYQQNYLDYRLTGNAAKKTAYESAQRSIEAYLSQLRGTLQSNTEYVDAFLQEYARTNADIVKSVSSPEAKAKYEELGFRVTGTSRDQFARIIAADTVTWGKAVAATGFKAD